MRYSRRRWSVMTKELEGAPRTLQRTARTTDRKEKHGYCQESCEEDRGQEAGREEERCEEAGRQEERREETCGEEERCEEARGEEGAGCEAQAERSLHEGDAALVAARRGRRQFADAAHRSHEEDLGLHQEEQAAGWCQQAPDQRRRQAARGVRGQEQG